MCHAVSSKMIGNWEASHTMVKINCALYCSSFIWSSLCTL